jgi:hypothetical protein
MMTPMLLDHPGEGIGLKVVTMRILLNILWTQEMGIKIPRWKTSLSLCKLSKCAMIIGIKTQECLKNFPSRSYIGRIGFSLILANGIAGGKVRQV